MVTRKFNKKQNGYIVYGLFYMTVVKLLNWKLDCARKSWSTDHRTSWKL